MLAFQKTGTAVSYRREQPVRKGKVPRGLEISAAASENTMPQRLTDARYVPPSSIELRFADDSFLLAIEKLEMPVDRIRWDTAKAAPTGEAMTVVAIHGEPIPIDSATLRYLVDPDYAEKADAMLRGMQFTDDELERVVRDNPAPPEWHAQPSRDLTSESWK